MRNNKRFLAGGALSCCASLLFLLSPGRQVWAQSGDAVLGGLVKDATGAVVPGATVTVTNDENGVAQKTASNKSGSFSLAGLTPGNYSARIAHDGFADVEVLHIVLSVSDNRQLAVKLPVAQSQQTVSVNGDSATINTTNATVGTVVDRQFVQEIPLNGRSFQSLILLTPGVVSSTPQGGYASGDYSVNGLPSDSNNFTLDGASASNTNAAKFNALYGGAGTAGMGANATALGSTQGLISVDALQEFQISTSTYSAEFGRQPGAQISFQSRSGTNAYHGIAFDYLRNSALDANNWYNDYAKPIVPRPAERQNDFGGVFGGPLGVPGLYSGKDRSFFFVSYEGLRLTEPGAAGVGYVPSNGTNNEGVYANPLLENLRANSPAALQPVLNGFPTPNCTLARDLQCVDHGDGMSPVLVSPTTAGRIDAISGRLDFEVPHATRLFARYSDTESSSLANIASGELGNSAGTTQRTRIYLLGANSALGASLTNELRLQYSPSLFRNLNLPPTYGGGATPVNLLDLGGITSGEIGMVFSFPSESTNMYAENAGTRQFQTNLTDTLTWQHGNHLFKAGANYIQTKAYMADGPLSRGPVAYYFFSNGTQVLNNSLGEIETVGVARQDPNFKNLGVFFQDEWRLHPRLSLSLGLRWDFSPSPTVSGAAPRTYDGDLTNPASLTLAPVGTPLYGATYTNFAPRAGFAAVLHNEPGHELVLRAGSGLFFGTGQAYMAVIGDGYGLGASHTQIFTPTAPATFPLSFPIPPSAMNNVIPPTTPPYALGYVVNRNYTPPMVIQWSAALEQAVGKAQTFTLSYVGTVPPQLAHWYEYSPAKFNPLFSSFYAYQNGAGSNYNALQAQFKRQAFRGLQVLAGYTWSHTIDSDSTDYFGGLVLQKGNSDFDVRNNFNAALVYNLPGSYSTSWEKALLGGWSGDLRFAARSAFPVQVQGPTVLDSVTGLEYASRLNYNGQNAYVYKSKIPGGRQFNPAVFSVPTAAEGSNGNAPRNFLRGFGYNEADVSIQRRFSLYESVGLLFRAEAFNIANHPAFGAVNVTCGISTPGQPCNNSLMGQATSTLSGSLGGLASLYQQGGPRSLQLALKLQF